MWSSPVNRHHPTAPEHQILDFLTHLALFRVNTAADIDIAANYLRRYYDGWTTQLVGDWLRRHLIQPDQPPTSLPRWSADGIERRIPFGPARSARGKRAGQAGKSPSIPEAPSQSPNFSPICDEIERQPVNGETQHTPSTTGTPPGPTQDPVDPADQVQRIVQYCIQFLSSAIRDDLIAPLQTNRPLVQFVCHQLIQRLVPATRAFAVEICTTCRDDIVNLRIIHLKRTGPGHLERARDCRAHHVARRSAQSLIESER